MGTTLVFDYATFALNIPESSYWVTNIGMSMDVLHAGRGVVQVAAERASGEGVADGWQSLGVLHSHTANELTWYSLHVNATDLFDRHPSDPDTSRLAVETSRVYRVSSYSDASSSHGGWSSMVMAATYHAITFSVTREITGYDGDGDDIPVEIYRADTKDHLYQATSAAGDYTFTAYDSTIALFAEAREDATHVGRSNNFTPS